MATPAEVPKRALTDIPLCLARAQDLRVCLRSCRATRRAGTQPGFAGRLLSAGPDSEDLVDRPQALAGIAAM
jgi:hypothetical protein